MDKKFIKDLNTLAKAMGFGSVTGYDKLWGTVVNTFGKRTASMWFFTVELSDQDKVCGVEINRTYFKDTPQTTALNQHCSFDNQKTIQECLEIIKNLPKA